MCYRIRLVLFSLLCFISLSTFASITLFVEPDDGYQPVLNEINSAQESLDMAMYILKDNRIIHALIAAKKRGVNVRILLEKKPYLGSSRQAWLTRKRLEKAGIPVKWSDPAFFYFLHEKAFDVDQKHLVIMTLNQTYSAYHFNREYGAINSSPNDVSEFLKVFEGDWNRTYPQVMAKNLIWSPNNSACKLIGLIKSAQHTILVEAETLQDKAIENLLTQKAQQGLNIRIILRSQNNRRDLQPMINAGVIIRTFGKDQLRMHAKLIIVDDKKAYLGSENFTSTSLQMNRELGILVYPYDNLQRLSQTFEKDWSRAIKIV